MYRLGLKVKELAAEGLSPKKIADALSRNLGRAVPQTRVREWLEGS